MAGESILIVDDSPLNLKFARLLLESEGYVIAIAKEGNDALSTISTFKPQLILMDVQMPGIDGLELTRHIKANPDTRDIIVVALTAYAMPQDEEKARSAGCDGYVSKPFDSQKLLLQIRQYFDAKTGPGLNIPTKRVVPVAEATEKVDATLPGDVSVEQVENVSVHSITREFLVAGEKQSRRLYEELETGLDVPAARRHLHQWAGIGTTLGFPQISQAARAIGTLLDFSGSNVDLLEARCKELRQLFSDASNDVQRGAPVRAEIIEILSHRSVALIGFAAPEASQTQRLLRQAGAFCESVARSAGQWRRPYLRYRDS